jgi:hypothetical protein
MSLHSGLNIWASKIYSLEAKIKTLNGHNFIFIFKDLDVILTLLMYRSLRNVFLNFLLE